MRTNQNVVLLKGTSGSGKTYIAEQVLKALDEKEGLRQTFAIGPKGKVGGYLWKDQKVAVIGRYESACGGCDSMSWKGAADDIEDKIVELAEEGYDVFFEGLIVATWGVDRMLRLTANPKINFVVIHLTTPLAECISSVESRRAARAAAEGKEVTPLDPANTASKHRSLQSTTRMQRSRGVHVDELDRAEALARVLGLLTL
jgi:ABC-type dipeptide/oligopeptide/nickel transport system ATPase component